MATPQVHASMASPTLNDDILLMLPFHMRNKKTLLAFMFTCRQLYSAGMHWLLRLRFHLTPASIQAFYTFLLADPSRFTALRDLSIPGRVPSDQASAVEDILRRAVNLKSLRIKPSTDRSVITITFQSLSNLEELLFDYVFRLEPVDILNSLQCPLKRVYARNFSGSMMAALSRFRSTAERVACSIDRGDRAPGGHSFPKVISLRDTPCPGLHMSVLAAFPSLQILVLNYRSCAFNHVREERDDPGAHRYGVVRHTNIAFQERHQVWDALVYLYTDAACLYIYAPRCRVTSLGIRKLNLSGGRSLAWFHASLASMQPAYLHIHSLIGRPARFAEVLACGTDGVRKLSMHLVVTSKRGQYQEGLDALLDALPAGLRVLDCGISAAWARGERRGKGGDTRLVHHPATAFLRELDVEAVVQRALQAAPDLVAVRLRFPPGKAGAPRRKYHWVREEGAAAGSLRGASAREYEVASAVDREVVNFLKENHYGHP